MISHVNIAIEFQPLLDYIRKIKSGELHYLPIEETSWIDIPTDAAVTRIVNALAEVVQVLHQFDAVSEVKQDSG